MAVARKAPASSVASKHRMASARSMSQRSAGELARTLPGLHLVPVDGLAIARRHGLGRIVNSALLGAFARAIGAPDLPMLEATLRERAPKLKDANVAACEEGWRCADAQLRTEVAS